MTENELRQLVREQILTRFKEKNLNEQSKKPAVPGSEKMDVKFDPKVLVKALGADKEMNVSALTTAVGNASKGKRSSADDKILGDLLIKLLDAPDKNAAITALKAIKAQPTSKKEEPKKEGRIREQKEKPDPEVQKAVDQLVAMNAQMSSIAADVAKGDEKEKKTEVVGTVAGLAIGLPGLFHAMAKMASFSAKMFNKVGGKFDPEKEGETFHHWSTATKNFYIEKLLTPIVKRVFKKQIAGNAKKARIYAEVVYAVLLAAVAVHAGIEIATHGVQAFQSLGGVAKTAFEAAHGAETGLSSAGMVSGLRAAFAAIGEAEAIEALQTVGQAA